MSVLVRGGHFVRLFHNRVDFYESPWKECPPSMRAQRYLKPALVQLLHLTKPEHMEERVWITSEVFEADTLGIFDRPTRVIGISA